MISSENIVHIQEYTISIEMFFFGFDFHYNTIYIHYIKFIYWLLLVYDSTVVELFIFIYIEQHSNKTLKTRNRKMRFIKLKGA